VFPSNTEGALNCLEKEAAQNDSNLQQGLAFFMEIEDALKKEALGNA